MDTFFIILGVLGGLLALLLIYAATKPANFRVERSTTIKAPPEKIFPLISDFHQWPGWSPWENIDPNLKRSYSGSENGLGAVYGWEGNKRVGQGRMEITESAEPRKIVIKLDFLKPFEAHNTAEFSLTPQGESTSVVWAMHGRQPYMLKVMTTLFFNMDSMVGKDFEKGLASMKAIAEK